MACGTHSWAKLPNIVHTMTYSMLIHGPQAPITLNMSSTYSMLTVQNTCWHAQRKGAPLAHERLCGRAAVRLNQCPPPVAHDGA